MNVFVLMTSELEIFVHAGDFSIANIATIKEGKEVKQRQYRKQTPVDLVEDLLGFMLIESELTRWLAREESDIESTWLTFSSLSTVSTATPPPVFSRWDASVFSSELVLEEIGAVEAMSERS